MAELTSVLVGVVAGAALGAWLARRNEKKATTERLFVEAVNDVVGGIAGVAKNVPAAQAQYASALARVALHGSPDVVRAFRLHQEDATTITFEGRRLLIAAVQQSRKELGRQPLNEDDLSVLLFGPDPGDRERLQP
jgi:hypothetical protein